MADADGDAGVAAATPERAAWLPRRASVLAFVAFVVLFGQPAAVFALAVTAPSPAVLAVVAGGSALLAVPLAGAFVRQGRSVERLADFVIVAAAVQIVGWLASGVVAAATGGPAVALVKPALAVCAYPVAYCVVYRGPWFAPLG